MDENEDKIVGGDIVNDISERPFQVALETDFGFQFCGMYNIILTLFFKWISILFVSSILLFLVLGGSIIDDYTVLTAGHCCDNGPAEDYRVRAGALRVTHNADGKVIFGLLF